MSRRGLPDIEDVGAMSPGVPRKNSAFRENEIDEAEMKVFEPKFDSAVAKNELVVGRDKDQRQSSHGGLGKIISRPELELTAGVSARGRRDSDHRPSALSESQRSGHTQVSSASTSATPTLNPPADGSPSHRSGAITTGGISGLTGDEELPILATVVAQPQFENSTTTRKPESLSFRQLVTDRRILTLFAIWMLIMIGLVVALVMTLGKRSPRSEGIASPAGKDNQTTVNPDDGSTVASSSTPTITPSAAPTLANELQVILATGLEMNPAAEKALQWVSDDPNILSYNDERILQRFALASFYFEVQSNGPPFVWEGDFQNVTDECQWTGIQCDSNKEVTLLDVNSMGLYGTLPVQLSLLTKLQDFIVWSNHFNGDFPIEFQAWQNLRGLYIAANDYTGPIPSFTYQMTSIEVFSVEWNRWDGGPFPSELLEMPKLTSLDVSGTQRTGPIPDAIYDKASFGGVAFSDNQLTGTLSTKIGRLKSLSFLDISTNQFDGPIPSEIGLLTNLGWFHLFKNEFTGTIPTELALLTALTSFDLSTNSLRGALPEGLTYLVNINNRFGVAENQLTGTIPTGVGRFQQLTSTIDFHNNNFTGPIPSELAYLTKLTGSVALYNNLLTGTIPTQLGNLSLLQDLSLHHNMDVNGTIPVHLGNMTALTSLTVYDTSLKGSVPSEICRLREQGVLSTISVGCDVVCNCCEGCF